MWHVDEGTVHAYLDERERPGAALDAALRERVEQHVAECATCAARLAGEAKLRDRAAAILGASAPEMLELPGFLAPSDAPPAAASARPRRPWVRLAWAASILAAVGAGWMGSALWRSEGGQGTMLEQSAAPAPSGDQAVDVAEAPPPALPAALPPSTDAPTRPAEVASAPAGAGAGVQGRTGVGQVAGGVSAPVAVAPTPAADATAVENAIASARPPEAEVRAQVAAAEAERAEGRRPPAAAPAQAEAIVVTAAPPPPRAPNRAAKSSSLAAEAGQRERWSAAQYPADADVAWEVVSPEAAAGVLADSLYVLDGAALDRVAISRDGTRVLVVSRAPQGDVEIVAWRGAGRDARDFGAVATDASGRQTVTVQRGGVTLALRAPPGAGVLPVAGRLVRWQPE